MNSHHGPASLKRPEPVGRIGALRSTGGGVACFESPRTRPGKIGALAGFGPAGSAALMYRDTVSRCTSSALAIRRADQPCAFNESIDCTIAILSRFAMTGLLPRTS